MPTFKKMDKAAVGADAPLSGFATKRMTENLSAINEQRMIMGAPYVWGITNPPLWGGVAEKWTPLFLPIVPEARTLKIRLRYEVAFAPVNWRASLILAANVATDPGDFTALAITSGRTTSGWIEIDLTEAQRRGMSVAQVALRIQSDASDTTANLTTLLSGGREEHISVSGNPLSTFNASDVCSLQLIDASGSAAPILWPAESITQTIRMHASGQLYTWPKPPTYTSTLENANTIKLTRMGQLKVYCIEWQLVHGTPYLSSRPSFPWQSDAEMYKTIEVGRGGSAVRLGKLYDATEILAGYRVPVWSVFPGAPGGQVPANWGDQDSNFTQYCHYTTKLGDTWQTLCCAPIGPDITLDGAVNLERRAVEVRLFILPLADASKDRRWWFRLQTFAGGTPTASATGEETEVTITPVGPGSQQQYIHRFGVAPVTPADNPKRARNNLHGLYDLDTLGALGVHEVTLQIKDEGGTRPKMVKIQCMANAFPRHNWTLLVLGCIVSPPRSREWVDGGV